VATPNAGHEILVGENVIAAAGKDLGKGIADGLYTLPCLAAYFY
jgi:hypothetical protein